MQKEEVGNDDVVYRSVPFVPCPLGFQVLALVLVLLAGSVANADPEFPTPEPIGLERRAPVHAPWV